jgi:WD40 repeat protein/DNA-binding SARP family transcriptional activator
MSEGAAEAHAAAFTGADGSATFPDVDFRLLGPLEVECSDGVQPLGGTKQRAVLAHLLLNVNTLVSADRLIEDVWEGDPPAAGRNVLQSYVSRLRKLLGNERLEQRAGGYVLHASPDELDVRRFEALVGEARRLAPSDPEGAACAYHEAESLWRGRALADLPDPMSVREAATRLDERRLVAREESLVLDLALGRDSELVSELERLTREHPYRESLWGHLMTALYRCGRQAEALDAYRRARAVLLEDLGLEPSRDLRRLEERVLRQDPDLAVSGQPLRGYRLLEKVGEGAFASVHRALQPQVGREVAVKVVRPILADDPDFIRRFEAEAQLVARLEHPHIVPLYDYWREPGGAFLVMRYLRGGTLQHALERGPVPVERALAVVEDIAGALAHAHRQGVVHRDVKPANILLDDEGNAYLSDFGIARDASIARAHHRSREAGDWVSPEELRGEEPTARADVYSLGLVLFEMLSGADAGRSLHEVVRRATLEDPAGRYPDASALLAAVAAAVGTAARAVAVAVGPTRNPYKGLRPFQEADASDLHGRGRLVERLLHRLDAGDSLLALVGPSGAGKSSVVLAGLVPAIRARSEWYVATMVPGVDPLSELAAALARVAPAAPVGRGLGTDASTLLPGPDARLLLVVDQFEELFADGVEEQARAHFLAELSGVAHDHDCQVRVVLTLRADHLDRPLADPTFAPVLAAGTEHVLPLLPEELERVITSPAAAAGVHVEPGLVADLVSEVRGQAAPLPLLQFALTELFDHRDGGGLTVAAHRALGGMAGVVARAADELYERLDAGGQGLARQVFLRLLEVDDSGRALRRAVSRGQLVAVDEAADEVVEAYAGRRLLTFDRDERTREPTVEIAHDALLSSWARLAAWVEEAREDLRARRQLAAAAREWQEAGREASFLLRGTRLDSLSSWADQTALILAPREHELLRASLAGRDEAAAAEQERGARERALERRSVRRLRGVVAVLTAAALVAGVLSVLALDQRAQAREERRVALARGLAAASVANLADNGERSVLLALEALREAPPGAARDDALEALHRAVVASRVLLRVPGLGGSLDWSSDGKLFVTEGKEGSGVVDVRDARTGDRVRSFHGHDADVNLAVFSPDSALLATSADDGTLKLWEARTGRLRRAFTHSGGQVWGVSFSPEGRMVAASWYPDRVVVHDVGTGRVVRAVTQRDLSLSTSLSRDGRLLAIATSTGGAPVVDLRTGGTAFVVDKGAALLDVDFSPDGRWISTTSFDATVRVWHARDGSFAYELTGHSGEVPSADWSADSRSLATGSADGTARVWDIGPTAGHERLVITAQERGGGMGVALSPDGQRLMTGDQGITAVRIWDVSVRGGAEWTNVPAVAGLPSDVGLSPDGRRLVVPERAAFSVWDTGSGRRIATLKDVPHDEPLSLAVSTRGIVAAAIGDRVRGWSITGGAPLFDVRLPRRANGVAWDAAGERLAVASDGVVRLLSRDGTLLSTLEGSPGLAAWAVRFSPDGRSLAVNAVDLETSRPEASHVTLWDIDERREIRRLPVAAWALAFSPDGRSLGVAPMAGPASVDDVRTGRELATLVGHAGQVTTIAFSPDGRQVVTGSTDSTVRLWDWRAAKQEMVLRGHHDAVWSVAISRDGSRLASLSRDGVARVWALDPEELVGIARRKVTRELTDAECEQYLGRTCV